MLCKSSLLLALLSLAASLVRAVQPPYQVSIFVSLHPRAPSLHWCNGVILHSRVILTTAACVHYDSLANGQQPTIIDPARIYVVAGKTNVDEFPVASIDILPSFNATTLADDLAVLRLGTPLPLGMRDDMKWIVLDDNVNKNNSCIANFYARNSVDRIPDHKQVAEITIVEVQECLKAKDDRAVGPLAVPLTALAQARLNDLCGDYLLPLDFNCEDYDSFARYNADRGTGLVCNSLLAALLSSTLPLQARNHSSQVSCSERPVKALYVVLGPHLDWIYNIIMTEEFANHNNYVVAAPYSQNDLDLGDKPGSAGIAATDEALTSTSPSPVAAGSAATTATTATSTGRPAPTASNYPAAPFSCGASAAAQTWSRWTLFFSIALLAVCLRLSGSRL